ncbi:PAS/PAC sensor signal transduction histidine kinase [Ktedonobacter racemifer DSM 44963]|uniref:histidine kinase n=2 Tax=Ktedonobacter racemifer TaxID=363277 RepID=D6TQ87_KTERA|nr:PAS/PAC sensor signal transduction histidine kinase [Ktedonobacter racemifer DSM 44963]
MLLLPKGLSKGEKEIGNAMCSVDASVGVSPTSHPQLTSLLETLSDTLIFLDPSATIYYASTRAAAMLGTSKQKLQGGTLWQGAPHLVGTALYQAVTTAIHTQESLAITYRCPITQNWLRVRLLPTHGGVLLFFQKGKEPVRLSDALPQSEQRYRSLLESFTDGIVILTPEGLIIDINQHPLVVAQVSREEVIGRPMVDFPTWKSAPVAQKQLRAAIARASGGETVHFEVRLYPQAEHYRDLALVIIPHHADNQRIEYLTCVGLEVTERKQAEEEWRVLLDVLPHFVWVMRPDGSPSYQNRRWRDYTTVAVEDDQGIDGWSHWIHPDDRQRVLETWQAAVQSGNPYEVQHRLLEGETGTYRWYLTRGVPRKDQQGVIWQWVRTCTNVDELKEVETALYQSRERMRTLMDSNIIGIFISRDDEIIEANNTFLRMTGYSQEDLRQGNMDWFRMTHPDSFTRTQQAQQELTQHQTLLPYEKEYVCKDGSRLPVLVCAVAFPFDPSQNICFVLDNSARKELELRKENFLSMASHELKTPLTAIKMRLQLARVRLLKQGLGEAATMLSRAEEPVHLLDRLIGELLDVSKLQAGKLDYLYEPVDMEALVYEIAETTQLMSTTHTIVVHGSAPGTVIGDKGRLEQVFINLISNAIAYSPDANTVDIDLHATSEAVTVSVRDYGIGIPQGQREKIFERFYRAFDLSQRAVPGLGMGLTIAQEIVTQHGGTITVQSEEGKGSTFQVTLPLERPTS